MRIGDYEHAIIPSQAQRSGLQKPVGTTACSNHWDHCYVERFLGEPFSNIAIIAASDSEQALSI